ncbi:MAG: hypothetical protein IPL16_01175 [Ignavibacteria bacterium]|nr:hypothetical protein [Ignavibacteria bacterium]
MTRWNEAAARVYEKGHIPVIGVNAALSVYENFQERKVKSDHGYFLALVDKCDALLLIGESPGANRERDLILSSGKESVL